ncbi:Crp/Fnr family transcriptional regulator [Actinocorallia sp. B10E7]|uniref:Crp/Fnr family transcriptional regulator n=1 Tax=Actinocorallia sp. B10E7 TaxID=3153558 RepID=UPI00325EE56F
MRVVHAPASAREVSTRLAFLLRERLRSEAETREIAAKSCIYTLGQKDSHVYLIEHGTVKAHTFSEGGKSCILGIYSHDEIFGDSCLIGPYRRETATAMTDVLLKRIPRSRFMEIVSSPEISADWSCYQVKRLQEQQETITLLITVDSMQRLAAILLMLAERLGIRRGDRTIITNRFTHEELAQMVGTTRSRIGLFLKQFQQEGLIHVSRDSYLVLRQAHLRAFLSTRARQPI